MTKFFFSTILLLLIFGNAYTQSKMKKVEDLINTKETGWILVKGWIDSAKNKIEILSCDTEKAKDALFKTQVTTRSPMGAIIFTTGGLLIDDRWIRILGSGNIKLNRSLPDWNKGKSFKEFGEQPAFLLIADDAIGGFFAINGGAFGKDAGKVYYLAPYNLKWESLDLTYSEFLLFCFNNNLEEFYENLRWNNWRKDVLSLDGNMVYNFFPMLWSKEGKDINNVSKKAIPVEEQYDFNMDMKKRLGD